MLKKTSAPQNDVVLLESVGRSTFHAEQTEMCLDKYRMYCHKKHVVKFPTGGIPMTLVTPPKATNRSVKVFDYLVKYGLNSMTHTAAKLEFQPVQYLLGPSKLNKYPSATAVLWCVHSFVQRQLCICITTPFTSSPLS